MVGFRSVTGQQTKMIAWSLFQRRIFFGKRAIREIRTSSIEPTTTQPRLVNSWKKFTVTEMRHPNHEKNAYFLADESQLKFSIKDTFVISVDCDHKRQTR